MPRRSVILRVARNARPGRPDAKSHAATVIGFAERTRRVYAAPSICAMKAHTIVQREGTMHRALKTLVLGTAAVFATSSAFAQSGSVAKAASGYSFEEAAKEHPDTKNFHSADEHTSELQSQSNLVCRPLLEKKKIRH